MKPLPLGSYLIRPYKVFKTFDDTYVMYSPDSIASTIYAYDSFTDADSTYLYAHARDSGPSGNPFAAAWFGAGAWHSSINGTYNFAQTLADAGNHYWARSYVGVHDNFYVQADCCRIATWPGGGGDSLGISARMNSGSATSNSDANLHSITLKFVYSGGGSVNNMSVALETVVNGLQVEYTVLTGSTPWPTGSWKRLKMGFVGSTVDCYMSDTPTGANEVYLGSVTLNSNYTFNDSTSSYAGFGYLAYAGNNIDRWTVGSYGGVESTPTDAPNVVVMEAIPAPPAWDWSSLGPANSNGIYQYPLYDSVINLLYSNDTFQRSWNPTLNASGSYVINISERVYGEQVRPGSLILTSPSSTASILDDGVGNLYCDSDPTGFIGSIFYPMGIAVVGKMSVSSSLTSVINQDGIFISTGSVLGITFASQTTLYEHTIACTLERDEFNYSTNPSMTLFQSSSITGSSSILDAFSSGSLTPYITTLGFYNDVGEMVAVAKLPRPIKRAPELDQTFIVRIDVL